MDFKQMSWAASPRDRADYNRLPGSVEIWQIVALWSYQQSGGHRTNRWYARVDNADFTAPDGPTG
jgi:hypothetical protein